MFFSQMVAWFGLSASHLFDQTPSGGRPLLTIHGALDLHIQPVITLPSLLSFSFFLFSTLITWALPYISLKNLINFSHLLSSEKVIPLKTGIAFLLHLFSWFYLQRCAEYVTHQECSICSVNKVNRFQFSALIHQGKTRKSFKVLYLSSQSIELFSIHFKIL